MLEALSPASSRDAGLPRQRSRIEEGTRAVQRAPLTQSEGHSTRRRQQKRGRRSDARARPLGGLPPRRHKKKANRPVPGGGERAFHTHKNVSGGPMTVICHSKTFESSTSPAENPSTGFFMSSAEGEPG